MENEAKTSELVYNYEAKGGDHPRHTWSVVGPAGGVHIWASPITDRRWGKQFYGGVEVHSRTPMYGDEKPSHDECWLIGGPCWHDGTSLYFSENIEPMLRDRADFEPVRSYIEAELHDWYRSKLHTHTPNRADAGTGGKE